ncbi:hypothetical protein C9374_001594 [Naegleria lovaniensis]|uniref:Uncharacterized protein n=1 Tax=Naegleria lovaniensis TaxID=51637 RepID=A0AA88GQZ8_NAELO|nr:uncharacterized protein C9374_001594 [Naegleria lovaniensis]KAG2387262.1 hypothetical protein C9374_001594 [Naegleria lovaniensis]
MLPAVVPVSGHKKRKEPPPCTTESDDPLWRNIFAPGSFITLECYHVPSSHLVQDACNKKAERSNREQIAVAVSDSSEYYRFEMKTRVPKKTQNFKQLIKQLRIYWAVGTDDFYPGITFGTELYFPSNREDLLRIIKTHVDDWTTSDRLKKYHAKVSGKNFVLKGLDKVFKANKSYPLHEILDHTSTNHAESFKGRDLYKMYLDYDDLSVVKVDLIQSNATNEKSTDSTLFDEDENGDTDTEAMVTGSSDEKNEMMKKKKKLPSTITKLVASSKCEDDSFIQLVASLVKYENMPKDDIGKYGAMIEKCNDHALPRASSVIEKSTCNSYEFLKLAIELRMNDIVTLDQFYRYVAKCFTPSHPDDNRKLWLSCGSNLNMTCK